MLLTEGNKFSDDQDNADNFNKYFSAVGSSLANIFTSSYNKISFLSENLIHEKSSLCDVSLEELTNIVSDYKLSSAAHDRKSYADFLGRSICTKSRHASRMQ